LVERRPESAAPARGPTEGRSICAFDHRADRPDHAGVLVAGRRSALGEEGLEHFTP
jgi:hypothetical protein